MPRNCRWSRKHDRGQRERTASWLMAQSSDSSCLAHDRRSLAVQSRVALGGSMFRRSMFRKMLTVIAAAVAIPCLVFAQGRGKLADKPLPEGNGKATLEAACAGCHPINMITNTGHTGEEWQLLLERMISVGAVSLQKQVSTVEEYLTKNFPEGNVPRAVIIPGDVKISFKEWTAPTRGYRPHDPLST